MRRFAFSNRLRLTSREDFDRVFKKCSTRSSDALFTVLARTSEHNHPRLGLVVSRKAAGNAVRRHRLKRQVRERFRLDQHELPGADIVVIARHGIKQSNRIEISRSLAAHWERIREKCGHSLSS
ncbi:MAG: ribonuclease P protein component [Gammaproteobacteria bacterium]|nr:ribonuclease P protein component [Gammaproteobacteria bacterium]